MSKINKTILWIIAIIIVIALIWFGYQKENDVVEGEVIKIGAILPITGAPMVGEWAKNGIDMAVEEINAEKKEIEIIFEDSQMSANLGISAFNKLVDIDEVDVVISAMSAISVPLVSLAEDKKIAHFSTFVSIPNLAKDKNYTWRYHLTGDSESKEIAKYLYDNLDIKNVAVLYLNDEFGVGSYNSFKENYNGEIVISEKYDIKSTDIKTQLLKIKNKSPEAIYFIGTEIGFISSIKQFRELGINSICAGNSAILVFLEQLGESANNCYFTTAKFNSSNEETKEFVNNFVSRFDKNPNYANAEAYDIIYLIKEAFDLGSGDIIVGMGKIKIHKGPLGNLSIDEDRNVDVPISLGVIKNGKLEMIK